MTLTFSSELKKAIDRAIALRVPFVAYIMPGSDKMTFFADPDGVAALRSSRRFEVSPWGGAAVDKSYILDRLDEHGFLHWSSDRTESTGMDVKVWPSETTKAEYYQMLDDVIDHLQNCGGKTVISRTIIGDAGAVKWSDVAERYFSIHPEAFGYVYYTARQGFWLGASPEVLLKIDRDHFMTMALAGTRPLSEADEPWSGKNIAEQAIVRNYIVDALYDVGLSPECGKTETVTTGNIQHLRTLITGTTESASPQEIIGALNPTPALAGYPMTTALEQIAENETHPRRCYGGYIAVTDGDFYEAFVNLRCVNFDTEKWCVYVGSGIMPESDAEDEWLETEAKSLLLKTIINESKR